MKGAIEVSVGFLIIMVISALVLIFMMGWLTPLFGQLQQITRFATTQAEQQMMDKFADGDDVILATIPYKEKFEPGSEVYFKIGVKKMARVDEDDFFAMCVGTMESNTCTTPSELTPITVGTSGIQFKFSPMVKIEERADIVRSSAIMTIPSDTETGIYGFKIYVCSGNNVNAKCTGLADSYGQYDFIVQVS